MCVFAQTALDQVGGMKTISRSKSLGCGPLLHHREAPEDDMRTALTQEVLESVANFDVVPPPPPPPGGPSFIPASMESAFTTVTEEEDAAAEIDRLIQETKE